MFKTSISRYFLISLPIAMVAALTWSGMKATAAVPSAPIGAVEAIKGKGWGKTSIGGKYDKLVGDLVSLDEVLGTERHSHMKLTFVDGTVMSLGADAEITVDEMVYDPDDGKNDRVVLRLGVGAFYFVSGLVAKEKVTIITPTATIGIRGTELVINVSADGATSVGVSKGHAYIDSRSSGGGHSEVEVGNTARTNASGVVGRSFPGIDLTGDEDVDRNIPGVAEWLDEEPDEEDGKQLEDYAEKKNDDEENQDRTGDKGEDGGDRKGEAEDDNDYEDEDGKELNLAETFGSDDGNDGDSNEGKDGGSEGGDGGSEGGDGGSEGGDGGSEGGDGGSEGGDGGSEGGDGGSEGGDGGSEGGDGDDGGDDGGNESDGAENSDKNDSDDHS